MGMEKRNVIENGRTPQETDKIAEVIDEGVAAFMIKTGDTPAPIKDTKKEIEDNAKPR